MLITAVASVLALGAVACSGGGSGSMTTTVSGSGSPGSGKPTASLDVRAMPTEGHVTAGSIARIDVAVSGQTGAAANVSATATPVAVVSGNAPTFGVGATSSGDGRVTFMATEGGTTVEQVLYISADDNDIFWSTLGHNAAAKALLDARLARKAITAEQYEKDLELLEGGGADESKTVDR